MRATTTHRPSMFLQILCFLGAGKAAVLQHMDCCGIVHKLFVSLLLFWPSVDPESIYTVWRDSWKLPKSLQSSWRRREGSEIHREDWWYGKIKGEIRGRANNHVVGKANVV
eukprot:scaffold4675_cov101-Cylindrotheca_fusiformis.AAC.8